LELSNPNIHKASIVILLLLKNLLGFLKSVLDSIDWLSDIYIKRLDFDPLYFIVNNNGTIAKWVVEKQNVYLLQIAFI